MKIARFFAGFVSVVMMCGAAVVVLRRQELVDWWALRDYAPSTEVASIASATTMTGRGKTIFYVHDPKVEDSAAFNRDCTFGESTIVLGCYDGRGIYVYNVTDERLKGIHEVTAAHEMLHAAYDRLSDTDRKRIDALTQKTLTTVSSERIQNLVKTYQRQTPASVPNELHSIIGTEVEKLDPELEAYYAQYFDNRLAIVRMSQTYEQVFTDLKSQVDQYDAELSGMKTTIEQNEQDLLSQSDDLRAQRQRLDALLISGSTSAYNAAVPGYNAMVGAYNERVAAYKQLIADYNDKVATRNEISIEQNNLVNAIDSKAETL